MIERIILRWPNLIFLFNTYTITDRVFFRIEETLVKQTRQRTSPVNSKTRLYAPNTRVIPALPYIRTPLGTISNPFRPHSILQEDERGDKQE